MPEAEPNQTVIVKIPGVAQNSSIMLNALKENLPSLRIVIVVKDPISRIVSHILHEFRNEGDMYNHLEMPDINDIIMGRVFLPNPSKFKGNMMPEIFKIFNMLL